MRRLLWELGLLHRRDAGDEIHLMRLPYLRALPDLVAEIEGEENRDVNVRNEEVGRVPHEEDREAVDEDDEGAPEEAPYREPRLKATIVCALRAVEALGLLTAV